MTVFRIAKTEKRSMDISGLGAYRQGGRWNNPGTYMLYTSENSSLALLESLVHFSADNIPPDLYLIKFELKIESLKIFMLPDESYPQDWLVLDNMENKKLGDQWMSEGQYPAIKVRSAVNVYDHNILLNPLYPGYHDLIKVVLLEKLKLDSRLIS